MISAQFADIFFGNAINAGLLPVVLPAAVVDTLQDVIEADPDVPVTVDLVERVVRAPRVDAAFDIDDHSRRRLLEGLDDIGMTLNRADDITAFEAARPHWMPRTA